MPYYLGRTAPKTANVPMEIASIVPGLDQVAGEPSRANIRLFRSTYSITMDQIRTRPTEVFAASFTGYPMVMGLHLPFFNTKDQLLPITLPDLVVSFKNGIPALHAATLQNIGYEEINIRGKAALLFQRPTMANLEAISRAGAFSFTNTAVNTVNLQQMRDLVKISKIVMEAVSLCHFKEHIQSIVGTGGLIVAGKDMKTVQIQADGKAFNVYTCTPLPHLLELDDYDDDGNHITTIKTNKPDVKAIPSLPAIRFLKLAEMEKKTTNNAGGIYIPYIRRLSTPDYSLVPDFIKDHYYRKLGWNRDEVTRNFNSLVGSWVSIAQTGWGHQVSHLVKCVLLAYEAEATIRPVSNGSIYTGSVLSGSFHISYHGKVTESLSGDALQSELDSVNDHNQALEAILAIAETNWNKDLNGEYAKPTNVKSMRQLHDFLETVAFSPDDRITIKDYASKLSFPERPAPNGTSSLKNIFQYLVNRTQHIPTDIYLDRNFLLSTDRIELVFAAFGTTAPTFTTPGGVKTALSSTIGKINSQSRRKHGFTLRSVPVTVAVADFKQIETTKYVYNFAENKGKGIRERVLTGKEKEDIWSLLGDMVGVTQTDNVQAPTSTSSNPPQTGDNTFNQDYF